MSKYCALNPPERSPCIVPSPTAVVWLVNWNLVKTNAPLTCSQAVGAASCSAEAAKSETVGGRDRASASYAAADRVQAPASAARGRFRGIHGGRAAPSLPAEARTTSGGGGLAGSVPPALVRSRGCS